MPKEVDYVKLGQRIRKLRLEQGLNQAKLAEAVGCSNNYLSHIETAQCKLSLSMLLRLASLLGESTDYFLLDTPFATKEAIINRDIAAKLSKCNPAALNAVSRMIDTLLEQQRSLSEELSAAKDKHQCLRGSGGVDVMSFFKTSVKAGGRVLLIAQNATDTHNDVKHAHRCLFFTLLLIAR